MKINLKSLIGNTRSEAKSKADKAMAEKNWLEAEKNYEEHIKKFSEDFAALVQLGHAYKEQGKYGLAKKTYFSALSLDEKDADLHLQIGHLLKLMGDVDQALGYYKTSHDINPTLASERELKNSPFASSIEELYEHSVNSEVIYVELDDALIYLENHRTVTGIQRVQLEFARFCIENNCEYNGKEIMFVCNPPYQKFLWSLNNRDVMSIITSAFGASADHNALKGMIANARDNSFRVKPTSGQSYFVLGAFWVFNTVSGRFNHLKKENIKIGCYIHDLIPINFPEYCDEGLCHEFMLSFGDSMQIFDFIIANSYSTENEVASYRKKLGLPPMPVSTVQLAHANGVSDTLQEQWSKKISHLKGKKFALYVSTIEARKNHAFVVNAWKEMLNEGLNPPDLVLVGRFGWRVADLMNTLKQSRNFNGKIHILHGLTDAELNSLYKECSFTLFTSYVEGWGLPVGESLAHKKPCITSNTSSMPEVGGEFADYIDPLNLRDGINVIKKMCFDEDYRSSRERNIVENFKMRTWNDFSENLLENLCKNLNNIENTKDWQPTFLPGNIFRPSELSFGKYLSFDYPVNPVRLMLAASWGATENWGAWLLGSHAEIQFRLPDQKQEEVIVYLELFGAPFVGDDGAVSAYIGKKDEYDNEFDIKTVEIKKNNSFIIKLSGASDKNGLVEVNINVLGEIKKENDQPGARNFSVGIQSIAYAPASDFASRISIAEELVSKIAIL